MISEEHLQTPAVPLEVIEWLERIYPTPRPDWRASMDEVRFNAGQASVIQKLRVTYEEQTKLSLESTK